MYNFMENHFFTEKPVRCVIFMSGSGTNTEALLEYERSLASSPYAVAALVTDAPEASRTNELADRYGLPVVAHDLKAFYLENGEESVKLDTPRRRALREKWSQELWEKVKGFAPAFACFAGFTALKHCPGTALSQCSSGRFDPVCSRWFKALCRTSRFAR